MDEATVTKTIRALKTKITRRINEVNTKIEEGTVENSQHYLATLEEYKKDYKNALEKKLIASKEDDNDFENSYLEDHLYIDKIVEAMENIKMNTRRIAQPQNGPPVVPTENHNKGPKLHLQQLELPRFDGRPEEYPRFSRSFEMLIQRHEINEYEKFVYLKNCLQGKAKTVIDSLGSDEMTYEKAKILLERAFACKTTQQFAAIENLSSCKLPSGQSCGLEFAAKVTAAVEQIRSSGADMDTFLQYFAWNNMNDRFQKVIMDMTQKSKPSIKDILENIFEANNRYTELAKNDKKI